MGLTGIPPRGHVDWVLRKLTLDSTQTVFDGFMNAAAVAHRAAELASNNDDIIGFVVSNSIYEHCIDMAWAFDPVANYSPSPKQ